MPNLYLIRHGIAANRKDYPQNDTQRPLTPEGVKKTTQMAQRLQDLGLAFDLILTSPLVRAKQTADILQTVGVCEQVEISSHLAPEGNVIEWWNQGKPWKKYPQLALVGHEPDLGNWAECLIWGESKSHLVVKKGGIVGISLPETGSPFGQSVLFWLTPPRFLL